MPCGVRAGLAALAFLVAAAAPASGPGRHLILRAQSQSDRRSARPVPPAIRRRVGQRGRADRSRATTRRDQATDSRPAPSSTPLDAGAAGRRRARCGTAGQRGDAAAAARGGGHLRPRGPRPRPPGCPAAPGARRLRRPGSLRRADGDAEHTTRTRCWRRRTTPDLAGDVQADRVTEAQTTREAAVAAESTGRLRGGPGRVHASRPRPQRRPRSAGARRRRRRSSRPRPTHGPSEQALASLQSQKAAYAAQVDQLAGRRAADRRHAAPARRRGRAGPTAPPAPPPRRRPPPRRPRRRAADEGPADDRAAGGEARLAATSAKAPAPSATGRHDGQAGGHHGAGVRARARPSRLTTRPAIRPCPWRSATRCPAGRSSVDVRDGASTRCWACTACTRASTSAALRATPIHAAGAGTVIWAGDRHGYGNAVFIDHGSGVVTVYAHQSKIGVSVGPARRHRRGRSATSATPAWPPGPTCTSRCASAATAYDPLKFVSPR